MVAIFVRAIALILLAGPLPLLAEAYDPLRLPAGDITSRTVELKDATRDRAIPLRVYLPQTETPAPVILFSHGLGGSRDNNPYLGHHWARRGYVVVFVQHAGSDEGVWKDTGPGRRVAAMRKAASLENLVGRTKDVSATLDALVRWNGDKESPLHGRMDLLHIGMSGHSFGAVTTQALAGQSFAGGSVPFREDRIDAALMMSPSPPALGNPAVAFQTIKTPCLLMTGTKDDSPIGNTSPADRLRVFPALIHAPALQVVFEGATHMTFGDRALENEFGNENRHHKLILALSTAFWDSCLRGDKDAATWLTGGGARAILSPEDRWEMNQPVKDAR